ncbi:MAG: protein kinase [Acidobacteriia bacterium]|nr:protein kinase [Terriglobia bacterium]
MKDDECVGQWFGQECQRGWFQTVAEALVSLSAGTRLGPYEIIAPLGAGGMGEVYRARDHRLDRSVAVKVLPTELDSDPERLARFEREAKAVAALSHPNILAIFDFGRISGSVVAVMELLDGETLRERLSAGALPARKAVEIGVQIANGLAAAHEKGIVHRDLKPENVFITADGRVKILDFGLARVSAFPAVGETETVTTATPASTEPGVVMGTVGYMSPEQVRGLPADHRSDIFSFGAVLYEMLCGARAFKGDSAADTMSAILKEDPAELSEIDPSVPGPLALVVRHCLEKAPSERFQSARDAAFALSSSLTSTGAHAVRLTLMSSVRRWIPAAAVALVAAAVAFEAGRRSTGGPQGEGAAAQPGSLLQLTDQAGVETECSLAPDGKSFVYVSNASGNLDIYLQRVGGGNPVNLTQDCALDDYGPAFSPDGESIAFRSERDGGGIFIMGSTGEAGRKLADFGYDPSWSPDARQLAVSTGVFVSPTDRAEAGALWGIDLATGARRMIYRGGDAMQPSWSPHGKRIAFWGLKGESGQRDIWTVAADGSQKDGGAVAVTDDPALDWNPVWSPDGRSLYFSSSRGGTMNLWRVAIDATSGRVLGEPQPVTTPSAWSGWISFSRDGRRLAFAALDWRANLLKVGFDAVAERIVGVPVPILRSTQPIRDHEVSPDGGSLVFTRVGIREDLLVARVDGTGLRRLTDDPSRHRGPAWSPDGQRIAFYSDRGGSYQIWTVRPDGSGLQQITAISGTPNFPVWSPDGLRLATVILPTGAAIFTDLAHGPLKAASMLPALPEGSLFWPLQWSPDGSSLLGMETSARHVGVTTYSFRSGRYDSLLLEAARGWVTPVWLRDGRRILYRDREGISLLDTATRKSKQLLAVAGYMVGKSVGVTRDERWITFTESANEGDIWLMELR